MFPQLLPLPLQPSAQPSSWFHSSYSRWVASHGVFGHGPSSIGLEYGILPFARQRSPRRTLRGWGSQVPPTVGWSSFDPCREADYVLTERVGPASFCFLLAVFEHDVERSWVQGWEGYWYRIGYSQLSSAFLYVLHRASQFSPNRLVGIV